jgi:hypothetical protein
MVRTRHGRSNLGCLVVALLLAAGLYFGVNVGEVYLRYYRFRDAMTQNVRFASQRSDGEIKARLATFADSIGLPEGASKVRVRRTTHLIRISSEYYEHVELPLIIREVFLNPHAEGPL